MVSYLNENSFGRIRSFTKVVQQVLADVVSHSRDRLHLAAYEACNLVSTGLLLNLVSTGLLLNVEPSGQINYYQLLTT